MKTITIYKLIFLSFLFTFISCQKDAVVTNEQGKQDIAEKIIENLPVTVDNNTLVFTSEENFQECINMIGDYNTSQLDLFEKIIGFSSYRTQVNDTICDDDFFLTLLNPNAEIIIGDYLFKVDFTKEKTFATPIFIDENKKSESHLVFSWDDDIFEILKNGNQNLHKKSAKSFCPSNKEKYKYWVIYPDILTAREKIKAKVCYQRFGIYNSIIMKFKAEEFNIDSPLVNASYHTVGTNFYENKKKYKEFSRQNYTTFVGQGNEIHHRPYQSGRRLKRYFVSVKFSWNYTDSDGNHHDEKTLTISCP